MLRTTSTLIKRTSTSTALFLTQLRHQSSKTNLTQVNNLKESEALKKLKGQNKKNGDGYNALSNSNLLKTQSIKTKSQPSASTSTLTKQHQQQQQQQHQHQQQQQPTKEVRKPNLTNIPYITPTSPSLDQTHLQIDSFYAGYKPLSLSKLKPSLIPSKSSRLLNGYESCWSYSATGIESFPEWYVLDANRVNECIPFKRPLSEKEKVLRDAKDKNEAQEMKDDKDSKMTTGGRTKGVSGKRGRVKPLAVLMGTKKY